MAIGRAERFEERRPRVTAVFGHNDSVLAAVYDVLAVHAAHLAVIDRRDLWMWVSAIRKGPPRLP